MGAGLIAYSTATNFKRAYEKHGKAIPEERLPPMIVGAIVLPIGLFWFAWYVPFPPPKTRPPLLSTSS